MKNEIYDNHEHSFGIWFLDEEKNEVYRFCEDPNCMFKRSLPATPETRWQINQQNISESELINFLQIPPETPNIITELINFLKQHTNYLSANSKYNLLVRKLKEVEFSVFIDDYDRTCINLLSQFLSERNWEKYETILDFFDKFNQNNLQELNLNSYGTRRSH